MLIQPNKKVIKPKISKFDSSSKLLKALETIRENNGGTISYVFVRERIKFSKENPLGEIVQEKSTLYSAINPEVLYKMMDGRRVRRSPQEVIQIFDDTKWDNGASYYIIG